MGDLKISLVLATNASYRLAVQEGHAYSSYAPQTLVRLASLVPPDLGADIQLIDLVREPVPADLAQADLVGISTITCGAPFAYELADSLRCQGVTVVLGGAHPTALPDEAQMHADSVVVGYAERSWPLLLKDWQAGQLRQRYTDFDNPFLSPAPSLPFKLQRGKGYFFTGTFEFSRGCPNSCAFCSVSNLNNGQVYYKNAADLLSEIERHQKLALFLDSNFTENLEAARPLWEALRRAGIRWYAAGSLKFAAQAEAVRYAAACGCKGLLIGFESINEQALAYSNKVFNQPKDYTEIIRRLHDHDIQVLGCFVFGLDSDSPDIFARTVEFVQRAPIDIVRYAIATPFPGTRFYEQLAAERRLITSDWELYDTEHVVFSPRNMSVEQLYEGHLLAYRETYRLSAICQRVFNRFSFTSLLGNFSFRNLAYTFERGHKAYGSAVLTKKNFI